MDTPAGRMIELQAILARTFALAHRGRHAGQGFDLCGGTHCQVYRSGASPALRATVQRSHGLVMTMPNRQPIRAVFHASCGGSTSPAETAWEGRGVAYLKARPDEFCTHGRHAHWTFEAPRDQLRETLNRRRSTSPGAFLAGVDVIARDEAGRARLILISGERSPVVRAEEFRAVVSADFGALGLRSAKFEVKAVGRTFQFTGSGFGHGVGLCQEGARERLRAGHSLEQVLGYYYPGARLTRLNL